jgi:hypothetical protein
MKRIDRVELNRNQVSGRAIRKENGGSRRVGPSCGPRLAVSESRGIEAHFVDNELALHRPQFGHYKEPIYFVVGEQSEIDIGRSRPASC